MTAQGQGSRAARNRRLRPTWVRLVREPDLAQPDPVASIIRQVGPSLVIGLLLDGPQLAERWPARYASVFADDPGCADRSRQFGHPASLVILKELQRDPVKGRPLHADFQAISTRVGGSSRG